MIWLVKLLVFLSLIFLSNADANGNNTPVKLYSKTRVTIANAIVGDAITIHCFSGDDDLGTHQLAYLQPFSWRFRNNIIGTTKFFCTIYSQFGSGNYEVYSRDISVNRCGLDCLWQVQAHGPCLQQRGGLCCLPWQKAN